jgi:hypothetical protein
MITHDSHEEHDAQKFVSVVVVVVYPSIACGLERVDPSS